MDQIHGQAGNIVGFQHFPVDGLGIVHQRCGRIHNATVDNDGGKSAEGSKTSAAAAQQSFAEAYTRDKGTVLLSPCPRSYVSKIFSDKLRYGFREYINSLRINKARALLAESSLPISEIMYACGFSNQSSFNRVFQEFCGCTPREYKNRL